jgi:hypothetical protein
MASDSKRPGGLTALAVFNFIFGGLSLLGALGSAALIPFLGRISEQAASQDMPPAQRAQVEALADMSGSLFVLLAVVSLVTAVLLIVSGVGYLKLKKFLGRTIGNVYAIVSIVYSAASPFLLPAALGGGFGIAAIIGLIYPLLTLILLNTTFREDFVN